ncbi:glucose-6-phosphate isomerase [Pandoraea pnomenusa]|jgi:glucose-6-phosphate isomerase|uniref:Glucose-6-phosphate isomerase n=1 Tax=Pandoraea pnomenusa TaxID=93220 RepID=A0A378YEM1_9BURK|nr:glucose-6-phosphate isomerase [Pandoraea pnomenusa]AHB05737.1 glucose-6-phosphate isomerase [Pandoraea pnomenusa 3kgm]AIU25720.1 glucose-6-phosphate isomerase [Pandoraea pnomenusa]ANC46845.1 glucose-6-phosphate isomerase [Pandoraea pnomenusa]QDH60097.1 glucose-6-phosphate isomerase [Pandoraea pnomenusa]QDX22070.1 glucose-6-phosphate isomerase [Pandoraea pnomenusa]
MPYKSSVRLDQLPAWRTLLEHRDEIAGQHMRDWFAGRGANSRVENFSLRAAGLYLDYSKNRITEKTRTLLTHLARECNLPAKRDAMWAGENVNVTEQRAALHVALRAPRTMAFHDASGDVSHGVSDTLSRMRAFSDSVRSGAWVGATGKRIRHLINVGIGGSDLGPRMVCDALAVYGRHDLSAHFIANIDPTELARTLPSLDPESTLVVVCSKTFTTLETMTNARTIRAWFVDHGIPESELGRHFVAVSTNAEEAVRFGIRKENVFEFGEWVGGRYSLWSSIGLIIMLYLGARNFEALLAGAHAMDEHFRHAPLEANMPVLLGLLGVWYRNFFDAQTLSIAPYTDALQKLPPYLQQLDMESNGKSVQVDGTPVAWQTAPIIWGEPGTNGQHAYFQMLHQGTTLVPVDFIAVLEPQYDAPGLLDHHRKLLANCFAQSEALLQGGSMATAEQAGGPLGAQRRFDGNRPSNTLVIDKLSPERLGALIALYEHKVFVQAAIWNINPFDQWGVELGKTLCRAIEPELVDPDSLRSDAHDASTASLIRLAGEALKEKR